jgi:hypothetical protein
LPAADVVLIQTNVICAWNEMLCSDQKVSVIKSLSNWRTRYLCCPPRQLLF